MKAECGCYVEVSDGAWLVEASAFLCPQRHNQGDKVQPPNLSPPGSLDEQDTPRPIPDSEFIGPEPDAGGTVPVPSGTSQDSVERGYEVVGIDSVTELPIRRYDACPTCGRPDSTPALPEPVGDSQNVVSSGGSSVTREARRWLDAFIDQPEHPMARGYAAAIRAALVAATARAEEVSAAIPATFYAHLPTGQRVKRLVELWQRGTAAVNELEARAGQAERALAEAKLPTVEYVQTIYLLASETGRANDAEARAVELEAALNEIARGGTDYSPGYGGSWASRVARSALARAEDANEPERSRGPQDGSTAAPSPIRKDGGHSGSLTSPAAGGTSREDNTE